MIPVAPILSCSPTTLVARFAPRNAARNELPKKRSRPTGLDRKFAAVTEVQHVKRYINRQEIE
jgi:hypothetical protein